MFASFGIPDDVVGRDFFVEGLAGLEQRSHLRCQGRIVVVVGCEAVRPFDSGVPVFRPDAVASAGTGGPAQHSRIKREVEGGAETAQARLGIEQDITGCDDRGDLPGEFSDVIEEFDLLWKTGLIEARVWDDLGEGEQHTTGIANQEAIRDFR